MVDANEREALERRVSVLTLSLRHTDDDAVDTALNVLFVTMKPPSGNDVEIEVTIAAYKSVLADLPAWAVVAACTDAINGRGLSQTFAPAAAELRVRAERIAEPVMRERQRIRTVIEAADKGAPVQNDETRAATMAKVEPLLKEIRASAAEEDEKRKAIHRAAMERAKTIHNERIVEEAKAAGVEEQALYADPAKTIPVSMGLRKLLAEQAEART